MACKNCNKPKLNDCEDCAETFNTNCINFTGDRLNSEDTSTKNGSVRTLTSVIDALDAMSDCRNRQGKLVQGSYTVIKEDGCKILLLDGAFNNADITYTITLPKSDDLINQMIIIKDISDGNISGEVSWEFDTNFVTDVVLNKTTNLFEELVWGPHKVIWLQYTKTGINYEWQIISPSIGIPIELVIKDNDMSHNWVTQTDSEIKVKRLGKERKLEGLLTGGTLGTTVFILPQTDRPSSNHFQPALIDASPYLVFVNILTTGDVQISIPGYGGGTVDPNDSVSLWGINYFVD